MRYGHLIGGFLFLIFLFLLGILLVAPPKSDTKKVGVGEVSGSNATNTSSDTYFNNPQISSLLTVKYTDSGFSPDSVTIPKGGSISFENRSSDSFWPASDPEPLHDGYPEKGSCGGYFDPCTAIPSGVIWTLKFDISGKWGYHNHLNPAHKGTIFVK